MSSAPVSSDDTAHISPPRLVEAPLDSSAVSTAPSSPPAATDVMRPADANTMPPPPPPLSPLMCDHDLIIAQEGRSSEQPLPSGQGSDTLKPHSIKSAIADKAKSAKVDKGRKAGKVPSQSHPNHEAEVEREDGEWDGDHESVSASSAISCEELPDEQLDLFDWDGLNDRYHKKMKELCAQEQSVMDEFNQLIDVYIPLFSFQPGAQANC